MARSASSVVPCEQRSARGARPHTRYGSFWQSGAVIPLGQPAARQWAIVQAEF